MHHFILQKFWLQQTRGIIKQCTLCSQQYGIFSKQHICKRCFRSICNDCGPNKAMIFKQSTYKYKMHRICKKCQIQSKLLSNYIHLHKLELFKNSNIAKQWLNSNVQQNMISKINKIKKVDVRELYNELWQSYNYEYREFIGLIMNKYNEQQKQRVKNRIIQFLQKISQEYEIRIQNNIYIIMIIIFHLDQENSQLVLQRLNRRILRQELNKDNIMSWLRLQISDENELYKMQQLMDIINMRVSLGLNNLGINLILQMMNKLMMGDIEQIQKYYGGLLMNRKKIILNNLNNIKLIQIDLLRNYDMNQIRKYVDIFNNNKNKRINKNNIIQKYKQQQQIIIKSQSILINTKQQTIIKQQTILLNNNNNNKIQQLISQNKQLKIKNTQLYHNNLIQLQQMQSIIKNNQYNIHRQYQIITKLQTQNHQLKHLNSLLLNKLNLLANQLQQQHTQTPINIQNHNIQQITQVISSSKCTLF